MYVETCFENLLYFTTFFVWYKTLFIIILELSVTAAHAENHCSTNFFHHFEFFFKIQSHSSRKRNLNQGNGLHSKKKVVKTSISFWVTSTDQDAIGKSFTSSPSYLRRNLCQQTSLGLCQNMQPFSSVSLSKLARRGTCLKTYQTELTNTHTTSR